MSATAADRTDTVRRSLLAKLLALTIVGRIRAGRASEADHPHTLTASHRATLRICADVLVPGAAAAGVVEFVVTMLGRTDPWLCYRFVGLPVPVVQFYQSALSEIDRYCRQHLRRPLSEVSQRARSDFMGDLASGRLKHWRGPPQSLVYFVLRNDAVDAVYGQVSTYQQLQVPYMAHIIPPRGWPSV